MKKITLLFALLFVFATLPSFAAQADTVFAPNITELPIFDGEDTDACWQNIPWQPIDEVWITWGVPVPEDDYNGRYKIAWSSATNLLYFFVEIHDDVAVDGFESGVTPGTYNYDMIEIFIDEDQSGGLHVFDGTGSTGRDWGTNAENAFSYHIYAHIPGDGQTSPLNHVADTDGTGWGDRIDPNYMDHIPDFILKKQGNRYTRELSLKVFDDTYEKNRTEQARVQLAAGKKIGLSLAVCDNDDVNEDPAERDNFFGSVQVTKAAYNDHWMNANDYGTIKLVDSISKVEASQSDVQVPGIYIYPNPAQDKLSVEWHDANRGDVNFTIYNLIGQQVYSGRFQKSSQTFKAQLPVTSLHSGIYFLQTRFNNATRTQKFFKH